MKRTTMSRPRCLAVALVVLSGCADARQQDKMVGLDADPPRSDQGFALHREAVVRTSSSGPMVRPGHLTWAGPARNFLLVTDHYRGIVFQYLVNQGELLLARELQFDVGISGVAWGANRLFLASTSTASVGVYKSSGKWMYDLGGPGAFVYPTDIEVDDAKDVVFVLDSRAQSISVFTIDGERRATWSASALGLQNPVAMGLDPVRGELLVSDYGKLVGFGGGATIHVFDYDGNRRKTISGTTRFPRPQGIAVDGQGRILLVDALTCQLMVIDRESGAILASHGEPGTEPGQMLLPLDVAVDEAGRAFVSNNRAGRIELFEVGGGS